MRKHAPDKERNKYDVSTNKRVNWYRYEHWTGNGTGVVYYKLDGYHCNRHYTKSDIL